MKKVLITILAMSLAAVACQHEGAPRAEDVDVATLQAGFENPPQESRVQVWWHWMNGNITKDGLKKDLEWFKRIGLGGFHQFDGAGMTPTVVDERLIYMTPGWKDALKFATRTADSLGLWMTIASSPGWSATGGPWVKPEDGMKKIVWRTAETSGGKVDLQLPEPFRKTGAYQNGAPQGRGSALSSTEYYGDIATLAVKLPEGQKSVWDLNPKVSSSGGQFTLEMLNNDDVADGDILPENRNGAYAWICYEYPEPVTVRSLSVAGISGGGFEVSTGASDYALESSDDGKNWNRVSYVNGSRVSEVTLSVPATTARYFRLTVKNPEPPKAFDNGGYTFMMGAPGKKVTRISEFRLYPYSRVNRAEDKAAFTSTAKLMYVPTPESEGEAFAKAEDVVDVSSFVDESGRLKWDAPEGKWRIYRFGWSLTGKQNHPAPPEATGLEVDKLGKEPYARYFHTYYDMYKEATGGLIGKHGIQYILTDSYEAENNNWTPSMFEEFLSHRGYDLRPWLPVLAGEVLDSPERSDLFLHDWRQTIGDLYAENYDQLTKITRDEYGMVGGYYEAHEAGRAYVVDGMDVKKTASVPMGAMWTRAPWSLNPDGTPNFSLYENDDHESASVAHIYGQNYTAAESFTASGGYDAYSFHPGNLKAVADIELANGINRFVVHESAHQPSDDLVPGMSLGGVGQWFNRHETWAEMAGVWVDYLSRSSYMLQAGRNVADILFYYGEDSCVQSEIGSQSPGIPASYEWDYCSPTALKDEILAASDGTLYARTGKTCYKMIWMDRNVDYMSVDVLRKLDELVRAGAVLGGVRPHHRASLTDDPDEFDSLVKDIWDSSRPNVYEGKTLQEVLTAAGIAQDVNIGDDMRFAHRDGGKTQIYWINKPSDEFQDVTLSFRVSGLKPAVWHPEDCRVEEVSYRQKDGRTEVDLHLVPNDAVFVVFSGKAEQSADVPQHVSADVASIDTPWTVRFQEKRGAPAEAVFPELKSYTESSEFGIKYFSGVASYNNNFQLDGKPGELWIDLGEVANLAEVWVNGKYCGTVWKYPYRADISSAVHEGENTLELKVANVWSNRLIGDLQPDCPEKVTFTDTQHYKASDPLRTAGLLGPVKIMEIK